MCLAVTRPTFTLPPLDPRIVAEGANVLAEPFAAHPSALIAVPARRLADLRTSRPSARPRGGGSSPARRRRPAVSRNSERQPTSVQKEGPPTESGPKDQGKAEHRASALE